MIDYCLIICLELIFALELGWWMVYWLWLWRRKKFNFYFLNPY